jgi:hypothetical protein
MIRRLICATVAVLALPALAHAAPKDDVAAAAKKLSDAKGYAWHTETDFAGGQGNRFGGPTEGKTEKDGFTLLKVTRGDNTTEAVLKGDKGAVKTEDGWQSFDELRQEAQQAAAGGQAGQAGQGFRRGFMGRQLQNFKAPAAEAQDLASKTKELKKEGETISGELTEDAVKDLMTFRRGGGGNFNPPAPTNTSGSVKFWLKDGAIAKYEYNVKGTMSFNGNDIEIDRTTKVEVKDVGSTKVEVPEEAKKKLS